MGKEKPRDYDDVKKRKKEHTNYFERYGNYTHYVPVKYGSLLGKELVEHYVADFKDINGLHLDNATPSVRFGVNSPKTVTIDNYLIDFWGYVLDPFTFQVLITLMRWSYRKGFTNISITELAKRLDKTRSTVIKAIDTLESHFFLMKFQRKAVANGRSEPSTTNVFIRLREATPLLSKELYDTLPKFMQIEHDYLVDKLNAQKYDEDSYIMTVTRHKHTREFVAKKCDSQNKVDTDISFLIKEHGIYKVAQDFLLIDYEFDRYVKELLENIVPSKPSYDTFIRDSIFMADEGGFMSIVCKDDYCEQALNGGVFEKLFSRMIEEGRLLNVVDYKAIKFSTYYISEYNRRHIDC